MMSTLFRRPATLFYRLLTGAVALAALLLALYSLALFLAERALRTAERNDPWGDSLRFADYAPPPIPADQENATDYLEAAYVLLFGQEAVTHTGQQRQFDPEMSRAFQLIRELDSDPRPLSREEIEVFSSLVRRYDLALTIFDRAFERTLAARSAVDYESAMFELHGPDAMLLLNLAKLVRVRAALAAAQDRSAAAWHGVEALYRLAYWAAKSKPTLIFALVGRAIHELAALQAQDLLARGLEPGSRRALVLQEAQRLDVDRHFRMVLAAERAFAFSTIDDSRPVPEISISGISYHRKFQTLERFRLYRVLNALEFLRASAPTLEISLQPAPQRRTQDAAMAVVEPSPWAGLAAEYSFFFDTREFFDRRDQWIVSIDHLQIAFALEDWHTKAGQYPETLEALGIHWIDRFTNAPYIYRREGAGYVLYSTFDGIDNGGARKLWQWKDKDLVWRVLPASYARGQGSPSPG